MLPYQEKIPYKSSQKHQECTNNTKRTPRDPPKLHFIAPRKVTKWHQNYKRKMGENERGWGEILV